MPVFKYTVANREGKQLRGSVEAPDQNIAKSELSNLGFSVLTLEESAEILKKSNSPKFAFEAKDNNGKSISGTIPAKDRKEAFTRLQREYNLSVDVLWKEGSANKEDTLSLQSEESERIEKEKEQKIDEQKEKQFVKTKVEHLLQKVNEIIQKYEQDFDKQQNAEIQKKINKLLRIKSSTNTDYILKTAEELLEFIQSQEKTLKEKGNTDKQISLKMETKELMRELNTGSKPKTLSGDIIGKLERLKNNTNSEILTNFPEKTRNFFKTPATIKVIKEKISNYNKQIFDFVKLYFKEPTPEYKEKVKNSIKEVWEKRKSAVQNLKQVKKGIKEHKSSEKEKKKEGFYLKASEEINALSGWLLAFYTTYYFASLYLSTKDFGFSEIPKGFAVYDSKLFKYILIFLFLLHASTALKTNFFRQNALANIILPGIFIFGSIIAFLNF
ncbi:hypothetical protein JKY72_07215 [Candidatus Gracilibacteria bacterium]|nr:hypothetical protein [Candidatus Gracilibacteria bacterium]